MRIAFFLGRFPVLSEAFILNQITGLLDRGHEVDIYSLEGYSGEEKVHPDVVKYNLQSRTTYVPLIPENYVWRSLKGLGLAIKHVSKNPTGLLRSLNIFKYGKKAASLRMLYTTIPFLKCQSYDIIHCQFGTYALQAMLAHQTGLLQGKFLSAFRGYDISWYVKEKGEQIYDELFKYADFFLTNCEFFRKKAIKLGCPPAKIVVHGSGIDCSRFTFKPRYLPNDGCIRIATTGRLIEKKGIEYSIRAVAQITKNYPNLEYNIIGDGVLRESFEQLIQELGVSHLIKLLGWRNQKEIVEILDHSHIFIAPSVTAADGNQDAPVNTLKEAMAMGLPVISTFHGGIPELVQDGISGFLVPERDSDAIAQKLRYLIEHPQQWESMGKVGRAYVERHYDKNQLNDELVHLYQQLLTPERDTIPTDSPLDSPPLTVR